MAPLHIEIAKSILANPRDFSTDEFALWVKERGLNHSAAAGAISALIEKRLVQKIGEKHCGHYLGRNLNVYRLIPGKETDMQSMIDKSRKAPTKRSLAPVNPVSPEYRAMQCYDLIQFWLDGITRARLA